MLRRIRVTRALKELQIMSIAQLHTQYFIPALAPTPHSCFRNTQPARACFSTRACCLNSKISQREDVSSSSRQHKFGPARQSRMFCSKGPELVDGIESKPEGEPKGELEVRPEKGMGSNGKPTGQNKPKAQKKQKVEADQMESSNSSSAEVVRALRIGKVEELRAGGKEPYAYNWERTHRAAGLQEQFRGVPSGEEVPDAVVSVAGRVMARRTFGKLAFLTINDEMESIQLYCEKKRMEETEEKSFEMLKGALDVGDIVGARGTIKRTEKGELSVVVTHLSILTKSLLPLPDKWHGLTDIEKRYRQRYLDLIMNPAGAAVLRARAKIVSMMRRHMEDSDFVEIETPVLQGAAGGADARPFVTHHAALGQTMFLRIATELHLKRVMVGGFDRVFEIGRIFRNEGLSTRHNPEFTSIEMYQAYADYNDMMALAEELITRAALAVCGSLSVTYQGEELDLKGPWRRASMASLVKDATGLDFSGEKDVQVARSAATQALRAMGRDCPDSTFGSCPSVGHVLNQVFEEVVEKSLMQPTFVTDHPVQISPLAKPHRSIPGVVERFELFIYGREIANAFSELTDPIDQASCSFFPPLSLTSRRQRLEAQVTGHAQRSDSESEAYDVSLDEDFVTALEYGMPPTAGMGMGIDRIVMLLTDSPSIRDVIAFPVLKNVEEV
eukprot:jgi/Mesen1/980/ME000012S00520